MALTSLSFIPIGTGCKWMVKKLTFAIPLEIVFTTPLQTWNPYKISFLKKPAPKAKWLSSSAYSYYRTPHEFFKTHHKHEKLSVPSWAMKRGHRFVAQSGIFTTLPHIDGVGKLRTRYPVMPIHEENTRLYRKLDALKAIALEPDKYKHMFYDDICRVCHK